MDLSAGRRSILYLNADWTVDVSNRHGFSHTVRRLGSCEAYPFGAFPSETFPDSIS